MTAARPRDLLERQDSALCTSRPHDLPEGSARPRDFSMDDIYPSDSLLVEAVDPSEFPFLIAPQPRELTYAQSVRPRKVQYEEIQPHFDNDVDDLVVERRVRSRSLSGDMDPVGANSPIRSPEEAPEEPCVISEDGPLLEDGRHPVNFGKYWTVMSWEHCV